MESALVLILCVAIASSQGGHGRSAAVAMAWLISSEGLTPEAAQRRLSSVRHVRKSLYAQSAIKEYYARHAGQSHAS